MSVVRSAQAGWRVGATPGVAVKPLRDDRITGASTFLLRVDAGARVPLHEHPGGEELFIIQGDLRVDDVHLETGDYLYTPPEARHAAASQRGCVVLVTIPKPVRVLESRG
jgi:anti-sigma factor ChrR (cupin superfamily)